MKTYFPEDRYDTPEDFPRALGDKLLLGSRWWFYVQFARIVLRCRSYALKGIYDDPLWAETSMDVLRSIERSGGRFHLQGLDHLRSLKEPVVIIGNHMSTMETVVLPGIVVPFVPITFVVKDKLVRGPVFAPIMKSRDPIVVGRANPRQDLQAVLTKGTELLSKGTSVIIFPQSTRRVDFKPEHFNTLGVKLARRAGVKALPMALKTDFWGNGKRLKGFGPVDRSKPIHFAFGNPLTIHGNGAEEHQKIVDFVQSHLRQWQGREGVKA